MKFIKTAFKDLYIIKVLPHHDERGLFFRTYCKKEFAKIGHTKEFVQINHSKNKYKYTFRGLHYQIPPYKEVKVVRCIRGKVIDIIVDLRKDSETFLRDFQIELSEDNETMLYIPEGFAHGFITLKDNTQLIYYHSSYYVPNSEGGININDPILNIKLSRIPQILSEKDKNMPFISSLFNGI